MNAGPVRTEPGAARRRRTAVVGAVAVAAVLLTSACAAGRAAQTPNQKPSQDGVNATVGAIALRGLAIVSPNATAYVAGSAAPVKLVLVNTGQSADQLTDITSTSVSGWGAYTTAGAASQVQSAASASIAGLPPSALSSSGTDSNAPAPTPVTSVQIPAGSRVSYGVPEATGSLVLTGTKGQLYPGSTVRLTFTFAHAGAITVAVPIQLSDTPGEETIEPESSGASG